MSNYIPLLYIDAIAYPWTNNDADFVNLWKALDGA